jgi:hypothetical protein
MFSFPSLIILSLSIGLSSQKFESLLVKICFIRLKFSRRFRHTTVSVFDFVPTKIARKFHRCQLLGLSASCKPIF